MAADTNVVVITGRLTRKPETRAVGNGQVVELRLASNGTRKVGDQWEDQPGFYTVAVWGAQGDAVSRFCDKGSQVVVTGRLTWREWEKDGQKREAVGITASSVQFVGSKADGSSAPLSDAVDDAIPF